MKKNYFIFFMYTLLFNTVYSQQSNDAYSNLAKVSKNINLGIAAYNLEDLKYHAKISETSITQVKRLLNDETCPSAFDLSESISIYIETALLSDNLIAGRTYLEKTKDLIIKAFYEYDLCSNKDTNEEVFKDLKQQQAELKAQQALLEQRAKEIKQELADQEQKEFLLKKQQFIAANEKAIANTINAYNEVLKTCDCKAKVFNTSGNNLDMSTTNIEQIRTYFLDKTIATSKKYLNILNDCKK